MIKSLLPAFDWVPCVTFTRMMKSGGNGERKEGRKKKRKDMMGRNGGSDTMMKTRTENGGSDTMMKTRTEIRSQERYGVTVS